VEQLVKQGIFVVVAAGNNGEDACKFSPARSKFAFTVGSTDQQDRFSEFSNYGECVDINAPGSIIQSTLPNNQNGFMSGTSMAAPIVAGIASLYVSYPQNQRSTVQDLRRMFKSTATKQAIFNIPKNTVNLIAFQPLRDPNCNRFTTPPAEDHVEIGDLMKIPQQLFKLPPTIDQLLL
jgi:subtilisin family serine protease